MRWNPIRATLCHNLKKVISQPMARVEAMLCRRPVITTNMGAIQRLSRMVPQDS
jgi:hypothetical protein